MNVMSFRQARLKWLFLSVLTTKMVANWIDYLAMGVFNVFIDEFDDNRLSLHDLPRIIFLYNLAGID